MVGLIASFTQSALILVDVQNDFCPAYTTSLGEELPAGALAVTGGDEVIDPLNRLAAQMAQAGGKVIATADWHPPGHIAFASTHPGKKPGDTIDLPAVKGQILWPVHCVQGSKGACFHDKLQLNLIHLMFRKGFRKDLDSYSAFFENDRKTPTELANLLKGLAITTVLLGGLATDYCVLYSALDAARLGYKTIVLTNAVRAVGYPEGSEEKAFALMQEAGVIFADSEHIL